MPKVIFGLPQELLEDLDTYCLKNRYTRSELVRNAIRQVIYDIKLVDLHNASKIARE